MTLQNTAVRISTLYLSLERKLIKRLLESSCRKTHKTRGEGLWKNCETKIQLLWRRVAFLFSRCCTSSISGLLSILCIGSKTCLLLYFVNIGSPFDARIRQRIMSLLLFSSIAVSFDLMEIKLRLVRLDALKC